MGAVITANRTIRINFQQDMKLVVAQHNHRRGTGITIITGEPAGICQCGIAV